MGTGGNGAISLDGLVAVDNARTYHTSAALYWGSVPFPSLCVGRLAARDAADDEFEQY